MGIYLNIIIKVLVAKSGLSNGSFNKKDENNKEKIEYDEGTI